MAYETGTATSRDDLLQKLVDFAEAEAGFTEHAMASGVYRLQKGSIYWGFRGQATSISGYGNFGYIEARMMLELPTISNFTTLDKGQRHITNMALYQPANGPFFAYYFFTDGVSVNAVVEIVTGIFSHISFGSVTKFGSYTGGEFLTAEYTHTTAYQSASDTWYWNISTYGSMLVDSGHNTLGTSTTKGPGAVYYPQNSYGDHRDFAHISNNALGTLDGQRARFVARDTIVTTTNGSIVAKLLAASPNNFNSRTILANTYLTLFEDDAYQKDILAGHIDQIRILNMELIDPKEIVESVWQVFPHVQKAGDNSVAPISGNVGVAYRRE